MATSAKGENGMRLICPNCGAQYEVDESVIPETGRDVQCSGCGQTWFQQSRKMIEAAEAAEAEAAQAVPEGWEAEGLEAEGWGAEPEPDAEPHAAPAPEPEAVPHKPAVPPADASAAPPDEADLQLALAEALAGEPSPPKPEAQPEPKPEAAAPSVAPAPAVGAVPRRSLDDNLLAILREEAERESAARRAETVGLETQQEMNLEPAKAGTAADRAASKLASRPPAATKPVAPVRPRRPELDFSDLDSDFEEEAPELSADLSEGPAHSAAGRLVGPRRQMLPDIEEINSSLRASADRSGEPAALDTPQQLARQRSSFRLGFSLVLLIAVAGLLLYLFAAPLAARLPALTPVIESYVATVNTGRLWLDTQLETLIERVQGAPKTSG